MATPSEPSTILVLSPHIDDAALSLAGAMQHHQQLGERVVVATFATADPPGQLSDLARAVHRRWGNPAQPYADRRREDLTAQKLQGNIELRHLGLHDAIYRRGRDGSVYTRFSQLFVDPPDWDLEVRARMVAMMTKMAAELEPTWVFAPLGVGRNVDHAHVLHGAHAIDWGRARIALYEEQPYSTGRYPELTTDPVGKARSHCVFPDLQPMLIPVDWTHKRAVIECYASQLDELFGADRSGLEIMAEYARDLGQGRCVERYWTPTTPQA